MNVALRRIPGTSRRTATEEAREREVVLTGPDAVALKFNRTCRPRLYRVHGGSMDVWAMGCPPTMEGPRLVRARAVLMKRP